MEDQSCSTRRCVTNTHVLICHDLTLPLIAVTRGMVWLETNMFEAAAKGKFPWWVYLCKNMSDTGISKLLAIAQRSGCFWIEINYHNRRERSDTLWLSSLSMMLKTRFSDLELCRWEETKKATEKYENDQFKTFQEDCCDGCRFVKC